MRMWRMAAMAAVGAAAVGASSCGGASGCDFRGGSLNGAEPRCQEVRGGILAMSGTYEQACKSSGGSYLASGCPSQGVVAGCEQKTNNADGSTAIDWYYAPKTSAEVQADCTSPSTFRPTK